MKGMAWLGRCQGRALAWQEAVVWCQQPAWLERASMYKCNTYSDTVGLCAIGHRNT